MKEMEDIVLSRFVAALLGAAILCVAGPALVQVPVSIIRQGKLLEGILENVFSLKPAMYRYRHAGTDGARTVGFRAQEIEESFPDLLRLEQP